VIGRTVTVTNNAYLDNHCAGTGAKPESRFFPAARART